ncbi:unnamed protein product [Moneuplotes crassus]|uniref:Uncharacterized protein n=1 Tax=Euplotes crassus TaxID=5936 RepID=A0AAD1XPL6_EUPCR|nr:unnamed protein product [Moneuplotes crassus]
MKDVILFAAVITISIASTTLVDTDFFKFTISFSKNSSNRSNSDVTLSLKVSSTSSPLGNNYYASGACINVGTSSYQLTTDNSNLKGFSIEWKCNSRCNSLESVYDTVNFYAGSDWGADTSGVVFVQSTLTYVTYPAGVNSYSTNSKEVRHKWSGLTPTQLNSTVYFPNQSETWYVRCFAKFNYTHSLNYAAGISNLISTLESANNLSLKGGCPCAGLLIAGAISLVVALV